MRDYEGITIKTHYKVINEKINIYILLMSQRGII